MRVAIFGLGYVGTVCGTCLASHGHQVIGVDTQPVKVELLNQGIAPVVEPQLQDLLQAVVHSKAFVGTTEATEAITGAEVILLCVGTPSRRDGSLELDHLERVVRDVASHLHSASTFPIVAVRSTVPPGTLKWVSELLESESGLRAGIDFGVVVNPEFLREGSAISDFNNPPYTLIGTEHTSAIPIMKMLYGHLTAPVLVLSTGAAEILKYVNNSFHALKIAFANEVGQICKAHHIDSHEVMEAFCQDTRLNISKAYLKPGFPYGGSCLPKDLKALNHSAHIQGINAPVLGSVAASNDQHLIYCIQTIEDLGIRNIGVLGLSFKAETDDLRESPAVKVIETLIGRGYNVKVYDPHVNLSKLVGANRQYIESRIAHISALMTPSLLDLVSSSELIIITNNDPAYHSLSQSLTESHTVLDMTRLPEFTSYVGKYHGICW